MQSLVRSLFFAALAIPIAIMGCDTPEPTSAIVDNGFPKAPEADPSQQTVVYKVWWSVTLFSDPVPGGSTSDPNRVVPASDYAYALLAPHWDPSSDTPPSTLIAVRTKEKIAAERGETAHIAILPETIDGDCAAGGHLSQDDADIITQRIFPGEFASATYDAASCKTTPIPTSDAGAD